MFMLLTRRTSSPLLKMLRFRSSVFPTSTWPKFMLSAGDSEIRGATPEPVNDTVLGLPVVVSSCAMVNVAARCPGALG